MTSLSWEADAPNDTICNMHALGCRLERAEAWRLTFFLYGSGAIASNCLAVRDNSREESALSDSICNVRALVVGPRTSGGEAMYKATHSAIPQVWRNACMWQRPGCAGMPLVQRGRVEQFNIERAAPHAVGLRCMLERAGARRLALPFHDRGAATGGGRAVRGMPRVKRERVERLNIERARSNARRHDGAFFNEGSWHYGRGSAE